MATKPPDAPPPEGYKSSHDVQNLNSGAIWKNERKENERQPDYTGNLTVSCPHCKEEQEFRLSAWKRKEGANPRSPALNLRITPKDAQPTSSRRTAPPTDLDDDIPF